MYSPYPPQFDKHPVIEQLLDNMEMAMKSKLLYAACLDTGFMSSNNEFMKLAHHSNNITDENILAFNAISNNIRGIPVKVTDQDTEQNALIYQLNRIDSYNWVFEGCKENLTPFKIAYTSISQLRDAYKASL